MKGFSCHKRIFFILTACSQMMRQAHCLPKPTRTAAPMTTSSTDSNTTVLLIRILLILLVTSLLWPPLGRMCFLEFDWWFVPLCIEPEWTVWKIALLFFYVCALNFQNHLCFSHLSVVNGWIKPRDFLASDSQSIIYGFLKLERRDQQL